MIAYINDFALMMIIAIGSITLLPLVRVPRRAAGAEGSIALASGTAGPTRVASTRAIEFLIVSCDIEARWPL